MLVLKTTQSTHLLSFFFFKETNYQNNWKLLSNLSLKKKSTGSLKKQLFETKKKFRLEKGVRIVGSETGVKIPPNSVGNSSPNSITLFFFFFSVRVTPKWGSLIRAPPMRKEIGERRGFKVSITHLPNHQRWDAKMEAYVYS